MGHLFIFILFYFSVAFAQDNPASEMEMMLHEWSKAYLQKPQSMIPVRAQFILDNNQESWFLQIGADSMVTIQTGQSADVDFEFRASLGTYRKIYRGEWTALTAAGKAQASDKAPLEVNLGEGRNFNQERSRLFYFLQHFFNTTRPEIIRLGEIHSRQIHGGQEIPLFYYPGLRSAWYMVKKGQRLNEPGDTNPFHQAFIFTEGEGYAKIGADTVQVRGGESYYIPPNSDHVVWNENEQPLILIFLAWGEGA